MSDYLRKKVISYPINKEDICKKYNIEDIDGIEFIEELQGKFGFNINQFEIEYMVDYSDNNYPLRIYLEYLLYDTYGEESSGFGRSRYLSKNEQEKYSPIFQEILGEIDASKLKYIDYCWYNCCEPDDYYLKEDEFEKEV